MSLSARCALLSICLAACAGPPGQAGAEGATGPAGATGAAGPTGATGATGPDGTPGSAGTPGTAGTPGMQGTPGQNAWIVGPGLQLSLTAATVAADGTATVTFGIADGAGVALDRAGLFTVGAVRLGFVLASLGELVGPTAGPYLPSTTLTTGDGGLPSIQGAIETTGIFEDLGGGSYRYTFVARADPALRARTHTVALVASRLFEGRRFEANASLDFRPDGAAVTTRATLVPDSACDACHGELRAHGGTTRGVGTCALCHVAPSIDPETGNTLELGAMIHRLHRGAALPSVVAGAPYQLVSDAGVHDYSTVVFPQEISRCVACHAGAGDDRWKHRATRAGCGSCHDLTSFVTPVPPGQVAHAGGAQADDSSCMTCHAPGALSPIEARHQPASPVVEASILAVINTGPGQQPVVQFAVSVDGVPRDLLTAPLTRVVLTFAGPTTDYASSWQVTVQGSGASGVLAAGPQLGLFSYTAAAPIPLAATGSYAVGLEAYLQPTPTSVRSATRPPVAFFAVTDAAPVSRRAPVTTEACAACHQLLTAHGGTRGAVEYCALCHNPNLANEQRVARRESQTVLASSVDLKVMIHAIHSGPAHTQPYVLGGFPAPSKPNPDGTPVDFTATRYPNAPWRCEACHQPGSFTLPLAAAIQPSVERTLTCVEDPAADADDYCDVRVITGERFLAPTFAACSGCHDSISTSIHAEVMTSVSGRESCATCHGPNSDWDVARVHPRP